MKGKKLDNQDKHTDEIQVMDTGIALEEMTDSLMLCCVAALFAFRF